MYALVYVVCKIFLNQFSTCMHDKSFLVCCTVYSMCMYIVCIRVHLFPPPSFVCYTFFSSSFPFSFSLPACVFSSVAVSSCELSDEGRYVIMYVFQGSQQKNKLYYCDLEAISYKINGEPCTCTPYISTTCTCKCTTFLASFHCYTYTAWYIVFVYMHFLNLFSYTCTCFFIFFLLILFLLILFLPISCIPLLSYLSLLLLIILFPLPILSYSCI